MKDKTKKLLKKGLRLGGAIGLTTLVLGGSFLLGFETGRATNKPKDETSVSAAKPKEALQPKQAPSVNVEQDPTAYMLELEGRNDLYIKGKAELPRNFGTSDRLAFTIYGDITIQQNYTQNGGWKDQTGYLDVYYEYNKGQPWYILTTMGGDNYTPANGELIITFGKIGAWEWKILSTQEESLMNVDKALDWSIGRVRDKDYIEVDGMTNWVAMSTNTPYGMSLSLHNDTTITNSPIALTSGLCGIEIEGVYYRVWNIRAEWKVVGANVPISGFGNAIRTNKAGEYYSLPTITMDLEGGGSRILAYNNYAFDSGINTDGLTDYWDYSGLGNSQDTAKIYVWGEIASKHAADFKYPNQQSGYESYKNYLEAYNGTYKNWTPDLNWGKNPEEGYMNVFSLIGGALTGVAGLLSVTLLPGLTLGTIILVPFIVTMVIVVIKLLRK